MTLPSPDRTPTGQPVPKALPHPLRGLMVVLIVAVCAVAIAVASLAGVVWVRTQPVAAPTGPDVTVDAWARVTSAVANATVQSPGGLESVQVQDSAPSVSWRRTLHFGEPIQVNVVLVAQGETEDTGTLGSALCRITTGPNNDVLRTATVSVQNGTATCAWTNNGKG